MVNRYAEITSGISDSISSNDLVRMQYENLPYPEIDEEKLSEEEIYHKNDQENPFSISASDILEKKNHFLYQGNENFR